MVKHKWSNWLPFPDPSQLGILCAPFGPGCYELRRRSSRELVLCGKGRNVAHRMTSLLLDKSGGAGVRNNLRKREYVGEHLADIDYRTVACASKEEAQHLETELLRDNRYCFPT
jgi:hypothetical protein